MELWDSFIRWIEANPWRIGIAVAVASVPFIAIATAISRKFRDGFVYLLRLLIIGLKHLGPFLKTLRITTTKRIDEQYARRRAAEENDELSNPDFASTPPPPGWLLIRGGSRGLWKLVNRTGEVAHVVDLLFIGSNFSVSRYPTLPRRIRPDHELLFWGNILKSDFTTASHPARLSLTWEDSHGDQCIAQNEIVDGAYLVDYHF